METWIYELYNSELYHHGILGMKWGVRRYQNPDGTLTSAGKRRYSKEEKRAMRRYDYRKSDSYKNASRGERQARSTEYNRHKKMLGDWAANRIQYKYDKYGEDKTKNYKKERNKQIAIGTAIAAGYMAMAFGPALYSYSKSTAGFHKDVAGLYAASKGLKEVKGGFTPGFKQVREGGQMAERIAKKLGYL